MKEGTGTSTCYHEACGVSQANAEVHRMLCRVAGPQLQRKGLAHREEWRPIGNHLLACSMPGLSKCPCHKDQVSASSQRVTSAASQHNLCKWLYLIQSAILTACLHAFCIAVNAYLQQSRAESVHGRKGYPGCHRRAHRMSSF